MKILVTGGCGFIGSNLVDELVKLGHDVCVIDNLSSTAHDQFYFNEKVTYYHCSILDFYSVSLCFEQNKPEFVFHLAAEARIQNCVDNPSGALEINTMGTQMILDMSRQHKVKRVMLSSTSAIYGLNEALPQTENMVPNCLNMYSYSKLFSEGLCKLYSDLYKLDTVCFRYFNVYGPRQPIRGSYAPVLGVFSRQKKNNEVMTVVGDGMQTRDYIHVSDIVSANILAMNNTGPINGEILNVGTETSYSILDIINMIGGEYTHVPARLGEARHTLSDCSKIKTILNWKSTKTLSDYINTI